MHLSDGEIRAYQDQELRPDRIHKSRHTWQAALNARHAGLYGLAANVLALCVVSLLTARASSTPMSS